MTVASELTEAGEQTLIPGVTPVGLADPGAVAALAVPDPARAGDEPTDPRPAL